MTSEFDHKHPRGDAGRFTEKHRPDPGNTMLGGMPTAAEVHDQVAGLLRRIDGVEELDEQTVRDLAATTAAVVELYRGVLDMADLVSKYDNWVIVQFNRGEETDEQDRDAVTLWAFGTRLGLRPNDATIIDRFGSYVDEQFRQLEGWQQRKVVKELAGIETCDDREFGDRAEIAIGADAVMSGYRHNAHYHVITDAMYAESKRRHQLLGHTADCHGTTLYDRAHNRVTRQNGYTPTPYEPCTCGHDTH